MRVIDENEIIKTIYDEEMTIEVTKREFLYFLSGIGRLNNSEAKNFMKTHNIYDKHIEMDTFLLYQKMTDIVKKYIDSNFAIHPNDEEEEEGEYY